MVSFQVKILGLSDAGEVNFRTTIVKTPFGIFLGVAINDHEVLVDVSCSQNHHYHDSGPISGFHQSMDVIPNNGWTQSFCCFNPSSDHPSILWKTKTLWGWKPLCWWWNPTCWYYMLLKVKPPWSISDTWKQCPSFIWLGYIQYMDK